MSAQPKWKCIQAMGYSRVLVDETGVYEPEMEIAQDIGRGFFEVYRFSLDRLKEVEGSEGPRRYLVTERYEPSWSHPLPSYEEWFAESLPHVARASGTSSSVLRECLCSETVLARAEAYEAIGSYHGFINLDSDPLMLTEDQLNERWAR